VLGVITVGHDRTRKGLRELFLFLTVLLHLTNLLCPSTKHPKQDKSSEPFFTLYPLPQDLLHHLLLHLDLNLHRLNLHPIYYPIYSNSLPLFVIRQNSFPYPPSASTPLSLSSLLSLLPPLLLQKP
jgi:hypothetical protein